MENNYVYYKLRRIFDWNGEKAAKMFHSVNYKTTQIQVFAWTKEESFEGFEAMPNDALSAILNALIVEKRGKKDDQPIIHETEITNNLILRKLKIALSMRDEDMIEVYNLVDLRIGKPELSSFFRDTKHAHYRVCGDQFLRNFLRGLEIKSGRITKKDSEVDLPLLD